MVRSCINTITACYPLCLTFNHYITKPTHFYKTRFSKENKLSRIHIESAKDESMLKSLGPKSWIKIPSPIKQSLSLKVFIKSYRDHLIGNFVNFDITFDWNNWSKYCCTYSCFCCTLTSVLPDTGPCITCFFPSIRGFLNCY